MGDPYRTYIITQKWCAIIVFIVSLITLGKAIKQTYRIASQFRMLYVILSLSAVTWLVILLTFVFGGNKVIYSLSLSYTAFQDLEIWLFAWSYYVGIRMSSLQTPVSNAQRSAWLLINLGVFIVTLAVISTLCIYSYKLQTATTLEEL